MKQQMDAKKNKLMLVQLQVPAASTWLYIFIDRNTSDGILVTMISIENSQR